MKKIYQIIFILLAAGLLASCGDDQKTKDGQAEVKKAIDASYLKDRPIAIELEAYVKTNKVPASEAVDMVNDIQAVSWVDKPLDVYLKARSTALQAGYKSFKDYGTGSTFKYPNGELFYQMKDLVGKGGVLRFSEFSEILERLKQKNMSLSEAKDLFMKKNEEWQKLSNYCSLFQAAIKLDKFRLGQAPLPVGLLKVAKFTELQIGVDGYLFDSGYDTFDKLGFVDGDSKKVIACEMNYRTTFMRASDERKYFEYKILYTAEEGNSDAEKYKNILTLAQGYESEIPLWMKKNGVKKLYSNYEFLLSGI